MKLLTITRRLVLAGAAALPMLAAGQFADAAEAIRFAVTDIAGLEDLQREYGAFRDTLAQATGYNIEFTAVSSRTAAVEAMRAKQVDFVLTGPLSTWCSRSAPMPKWSSVSSVPTTSP